jgi:hypothetical protein
MPLDYAVHALGNPVQGNHPPTPIMPPLATVAGLADNTPSADIIIGAATKLPVMLAVQSTIKSRLDIKPYTADPVTAAEIPPVLTPGTSGVVLQPDSVRIFTLQPGKYKLQNVAYV